MVNVIDIKNYDEFNSFKENDKDSLHVIKLGAEWCGPCKILSKLITNLDENKVKNVSFAEINIEDEGVENIVNELNVRSIPLTLFIKNNEILDKKTGSLTADVIYNIIDKYK